MVERTEGGCFNHTKKVLKNKKGEVKQCGCATDETSAVEMLSTSSRHPQELDFELQSHVCLSTGLTAQRNGAREDVEQIDE